MQFRTIPLIQEEFRISFPFLVVDICASSSEDHNRWTIIDIALYRHSSSFSNLLLKCDLSGLSRSSLFHCHEKVHIFPVVHRQYFNICIYPKKLPPGLGDFCVFRESPGICIMRCSSFYLQIILSSTGIPHAGPHPL